MFSSLSAIFLTVLILGLLFRQWILLLLSWLVAYALNKARSPIASGPPWVFPDGQLIDKFINGGTLSSQWAKYGPVYRVWALLTPEIVITTPEDVANFLSDSRQHEKSRSSNAGWLFHQMLGDAVGLVNGKRWQVLRSAFHPFFTSRAITNHIESLQKEAKNCIQNLHSEGKSVVFKPAVSLRLFPFYCTAAVTYDGINEAERKSLLKLSQSRMQIFSCIQQGGIYSWSIATVFKRGTYKRLQAFKKDWQRFNHHMWESRKTSAPESCICAVQSHYQRGPQEAEEILQTLDEMLFANLDVTAYVLTGLIIFLAHDSSLQGRLRSEDLLNDKPLDTYINSNTTFLHHCFLETLRLRPITAFSMPESSPERKRFGSHEIPPGTSVIIDTLSVNYNKEFWGKDSHKFRPQRFEHFSQPELRHSFFTFGMGTRQCLGKSLAEFSIKILVIELLRENRLSTANFNGANGQVTTAWHPLSEEEVVLEPLVSDEKEV